MPLLPGPGESMPYRSIIRSNRGSSTTAGMAPSTGPVPTASIRTPARSAASDRPVRSMPSPCRRADSSRPGGLPISIWLVWNSRCT